MEKLMKINSDFGPNKAIAVILLVINLIGIQGISVETAFGESHQVSKKKWKILHIMSYHSPWKWTDDQFNGFKFALKGLDIEYKLFQMDTKQENTEEGKQAAGIKAKDLIDTWKPDLVYTSDDDAQKYVVTRYVNSKIPFVFSGVNSDPATYGFVGSKNITGVLEQEHFVESVKLLKEIVPSVKKIAVIVDDGSTWPPVIARMKAMQDKLTGVKFVSWDVIKTFEQFKHKMFQLQTRADAVALLGIFTFKDESGQNVSYKKILRWTAENSRLPDFTFWKDRISHGTLCTVTVSGYEQGFAAGEMARGILLDGRSPSSYSMKPTVKGEPVVSLARARKLGIHIKTGILLSAQVIDHFSWE